MTEAGPSSSKRQKQKQNEWYLSYLDKHIRSSHRDLLGYPHDSEYHPTVILHASQVGPTETEWSITEKCAFFAALSRHSRLFPDLIARDCGKSESEVEWYLDLLEDGAEQSQTRLRVKRWEKSHRWRMGTAPAARQVSEDWIAKEEELSDLVKKEEKVDIDMDQLERLAQTFPPHAEWYARRLSSARPQAAAGGGKGGGGGSKKARIARDNLDLKRLESKPTLDAEEKAALAVLVNRRRNRQRYRLKQLLKVMSQQDIDAAGGPDVFFEKDGQGSGTPEKNDEIVRGTEQPEVDNEDVERRVKSEHDDDIEKRVMEQGWDMFNFTYFQSPISFSLLEYIYEELVTFLHRNIYRAIIIAESQSMDEITQDHINISPVTVFSPEINRSSGHEQGEDSMISTDDEQKEESDLTDEEDQKLDKMLDDVDDIYDEVLEEGLWHAYENNGKVLDWDDPLTWRIKRAKTHNIPERAAVLHSSYDAALAETMTARRRRRSIQQRSLRFPSTRLRLLGRSLRKRKNRATTVIIDSAEEEEGEGEGSGDGNKQMDENA